MSQTSPSSGARYRPLKFGVTRVTLRDGAGGVRYMRAEQPLAEHQRAEHEQVLGPLLRADREEQVDRERTGDRGLSARAIGEVWSYVSRHADAAG